MRLSIKAKLISAFGLVVVLTTAVGGVGYLKLEAANEAVDRILTERVASLHLAQAAEVHALQTIRAEKNALIAPNEAQLKSFIQKANDEYQKILDVLDEAAAKSRLINAKAVFIKLRSGAEANEAVTKKVLEYAVLDSERKARALVVAKAEPAETAAVDLLRNIVTTLSKTKGASGADEIDQYSKLRTQLRTVWDDTLRALTLQTVDEIDKVRENHAPLVKELVNQHTALRESGHSDSVS